MKTISKWIALLVALVGVTAASSAYAQATRTWVSGVGDDANPCSRTAPCKTFAGAISKTAAGGEINCLDPGGFGGVTITKSLSIICQYTEGGVLSAGAGVNGVIVNAGVNDEVYLRGIDFHGAGNAQNGIRFIAGAALAVEDCVIRSYNATNGLGISFQPSGSSELYISNTTIQNNGNAATGGGILIQPTGTGTARVHMVNVRANNNQNQNLRVDTTSNTGAATSVTIDNSQFNGSANGILVVTQPGGPFAVAMMNNLTVANNSGTGIIASNNGVVRISNSTITGNATGISPTAGGQIQSFGGNRLLSNPVVGAANNGTFSSTNTPS